MRKIFLYALLCLCIWLPAAPTGAERMHFTAQISDSDSFWKCAFYNKGDTPRQPHSVSLEWGEGSADRTHQILLIKQNQDSGSTVIETAAQTTVNLRLVVADKGGHPLSVWTFQTINKGKDETVTLLCPETVLPDFNRK